MALEEERLRVFILVTVENFKLEVCNDGSAVKQASKQAKRFQRNCSVYGLPGVFLLLEVWEGLKKKKLDLVTSVSPFPSKVLIKKRDRGAKSL